MNIVKKISEAIPSISKPAIYISGGLDSSIILSHLVANDLHPVAYTLEFGLIGDEIDKARRVADYFKVEHRVVHMNHLVERFPEILRHFDRPRYNVWPWYLAEAAAKSGHSAAFIGEGGDEQFGYADRTYLVGWANHIAYIMPAYGYAHKAFGLDLFAPFTQLSWVECIDYWFAHKIMLRRAYKGRLPDFILEQPAAPPAYAKYMDLWRVHFAPHFPRVLIRHERDVRRALQIIVAKIWVDVHREELG